MDTRHHQHYALDGEGKVVHIDDVEAGKKYFCLHCKQELVAKRGQKNEHHFAHKKDNPDCNWETYLHQLAKHKIAEWIKKSEQISLSFPTFCEKKANCPMNEDCQGEDKEFDLLKYYEFAGIEQPFGNFIPDILLLPKGKQTNPIFIEIFVNHACSDEKIKSGHRIIEFEIKDEADIRRIISQNKIGYREGVRQYGFKPQTTDKAGLEVARFTLHKSGKAFTDSVSCKNYEAHRKGLCQIIVNPQYTCLPGFYQWALVTALNHGVEYRNCHICRFSVWNDYYNAKICKLYKRYNLPMACADNNASTCPHYQQEQNDLYKDHPLGEPDIQEYIFLDNR